MSYGIGQNQTYLGEDRWRWCTWIEASDPELDRVSKVTWLLHHSFPQPVVETTDRQGRFAIERTGWGAFQIRAELALADGSKEPLRYWLQLSYPDEQAAVIRGAPAKGEAFASARGAPPRTRVFLSYGSEDSGLAAQVKEDMQQRGFDVRDASGVKPGEPVKAAVQKMIRDSDLVLGLVTSDFSSPYLIEELNAAEASAKPAIAVIGPQVREPFGLNKGVPRLNLDLAAPGSGIELAERLIKEPPAKE